jgi:hypothetical protein
LKGVQAMKLEELENALAALQALLKGSKGDWLVGGSCGLIMQGIELAEPPRDLDIYADLLTAKTMYKQLKAYAEDQFQESTTEIYHSYLSHYTIEEVPVELVGNFQVRSKGTNYKVKISSSLLAHSSVVYLGEAPIRLMPLAHELVFNMLRNREDRYLAVAALMKERLELTMPALNEIIRNNSFSSEHINKLSELLQQPITPTERKHFI